MLKSVSFGDGMMKKTSVDNFVSELEVKLPSHEKFLKLGDFTSLWQDESGNFFRLNYERGPLLYALIAKFKPKNVLEFGTGGGYGTLCMAWAMSDYDIDGKIYTIDRYSQDLRFDRPINYTEQFSPTVEHLSLRELWSKVASTDWLKHIEPLTGYSGEVMSHTKLPKIQMSYIDGAHSFNAVQHDFYSLLEVSDNEFGVLFDDYMSRPLYGVKEFIDQKVANNFDATLIDTDKERNYEKLKIPTNPEYGMCWIHSNSLKKPISVLYPKSTYLEIITKYRRYESLIMKKREKLNSMIPILSKIKFRWWKH